MAKYEIEVWDKTAGRIGDIRPMCQNLQWSKTRNDAESLSFDIDQNLFNIYLKATGYLDSPLSFIETGRTDFRVKRNGAYLFGANLVSMSYSGDETTVKKTYNAAGYLNYLSHRYINASYTGWYQEDILNDVLAKLQSQPGGDFGFTRGATVMGMRVKRDRTYVDKEVKTLFTQLSEVINGCDFDFTADKKLNVYAAIGRYRPSLRISYPGNVTRFNFTRSVENVANVIIGKGSGTGNDGVQATASDTIAADYCYRREKIATYNSVTDRNTLQQNVDAVLNATKQPFEIPTVILQNDTLDLNVVGIGDTIHLDMSESPDLELRRIDGNYRIEKITCSVDDTDSEEVTLDFDNLDIQKIIDQQQEAEA